MNLINAIYGDTEITEAHFAQTKRQQCSGLGLLWNLQISAAILTLLHLQRLLYVRSTHVHGSGPIFIGVHLFLSTTVAVILASLLPSRLLNSHLRLNGGVGLLLFRLVIILFFSTLVAKIDLSTVVVLVTVRPRRIFARMRFLGRFHELFSILFRVGAIVHVCPHVTL